MQAITVTIKGLPPGLLMRRFPLEPIEGIDKKSPDEQARLALYEQDGHPFVPGVNLQRALVAGAAFSKGKGRATLQKIVAACVFVEEAQLPLNGATWITDARPVTIPATKGRIVRYRPLFAAWEVNATLTYDDRLLTEQQLRRVVDDTGNLVGILDFRPERKGPFGRFIVTAWKLARGD